MRAILLDWLVDVHRKCKYQQVTLFLAASLLDRTLAKMPVSRRELQLVGVVALALAAKFHEVHPRTFQRMVWWTDNAYTVQQAEAMECRMLMVLDFRLDTETICTFLAPALQGLDRRTCQVAWYLAEKALMHIDMLRYSPSQIARTVANLASTLTGSSGLCRSKWVCKVVNELMVFVLHGSAAGRQPLEALEHKYREVQELILAQQCWW